MARYFLVLFLIGIAAQGVLAGHASWEPKLHSHDGMATLGAANIYLENSTDHTISKRWVGVQSGLTNADTQLWPKKTIRYCFEDVTAKGELFEDLKDAVQRWYASGLPDEFGFVEVSDSECVSNRANVLLIKYSAPGTGEGQSVMATTPAIPPLSGGFVGPQMVLTDDETMGMLDKVANYAHELGHAWGLIHEHQNPYFWPVADGGRGGTLFGGGNNFNCQNLKDYAAVQQKITDRINNYPGGLGSVVYGNDYANVCQLRQTARSYQFSAADYLPFPSGDISPGVTSQNDIDWDSIMIYPSGAGGLGNAAAGGPDSRQPILLKPDGSRIPINLYPSPQDVNGLVTLYGDVSTDDGPLLSDKKNSKFTKFKNVFKNSKSSGASSVC